MDNPFYQFKVAPSTLIKRPLIDANPYNSDFLDRQMLKFACDLEHLALCIHPSSGPYVLVIRQKRKCHDHTNDRDHHHQLNQGKFFTLDRSGLAISPRLD
jgi:hypothetical protein